jgi:predicted short-subunit dehydrogenase-like oxidoreductase (DUF2520 family)
MERATVERKKPQPARGRTPVRPTVSIVGAGRLGTALGLALERCGYPIKALVAERKTHARRAARLFSVEPLALSSIELRELPVSELLFITTPDDLISEVAAHIAAAGTGGTRRARPVALHTSGALASDELNSLRAVGFHTGSLHPLVAVSEARAGAESLRHAFFCIEGERAAMSAARRVVRDLGARAFSIKTKEKALYHAAAVTASGHAVALFDLATEMLGHCGLKTSDARSILMPLIKSTLDNLSQREPALALTGTFARADAATVRRHLAALRRAEVRDALPIYKLLGRRSVELAAKAGADPQSLAAILKLLK